MKTLTEASLKKAGVTIRERNGEWQVVDGRKIASRHSTYEDAFKAANKWVQAEACTQT